MTEKYASLFVYQSPKLSDLLETAKKLKGHNASVLITGESGTGKEVLARFIHGLEENQDRPFVPVHCGMFPDNLIESELFGHEEGAFTGAKEKRIGRFEMANGGDIFLDEIGTLKQETQVKLLRVLQDKEIYRLGGKQAISLNFRVIAATNENLEELVKQGKFRLDLYHRLNVIQLHVPSLKERRDDIEPLIGHFLDKFSNGSGIAKTITPETLEILKSHDWPGNVRELENVIQSAVILSSASVVIGSDILDQKIKRCQNTAKNSFDGLDKSFCITPLKLSLEHYERTLLKMALRVSQGNKTDAARKLDIHRTTLHDKMISFSIDEYAEDTLE